eukprot:COSAG01_NODE_22802_length_840_cov_3.294197_1_plen_106_part_00
MLRGHLGGAVPREVSLLLAVKALVAGFGHLGCSLRSGLHPLGHWVALSVLAEPVRMLVMGGRGDVRPDGLGPLEAPNVFCVLVTYPPGRRPRGEFLAVHSTATEL